MNRSLLEEQLGYSFTDEQWLHQALTHPSVDNKAKTNRAYERLEFLGDALLELVVSRELFSLFPKASEGELTQLRAAVVSREHLATLAEKLCWGDQIRMSPHLREVGGAGLRSILANTFESIIGAVLMDSQYKVARRVALHLLKNSLQSLGENQSIKKNPKVELLELLQSLNTQLLVSYKEEALGDNGTAPFLSRVYWGTDIVGEGQGGSKKAAQNAAAADALQRKVWEA